ncbi:MAG TPA: type II secretion system protein [Chthoniobacteraceae bacterium]|jgi:prepilin-type N-terminal cleavage/methylation domain-containing protein|nr:type II secretion system protein [Chthoniobacteraceae bacterium]
MKIPRTDRGIPLLIRLRQSFKAFTLIELLVVIGIIALLASIALPAFSSVQVKAQQTKSLNNAKQIGFACRAFGVDNNGQYPNYPETTGSFGNTQVTYSNDAFNDLVPTYLSTIQCFYQPGSYETPLPRPPADPDFTQCGSQTGVSALPSGSKLNHWAYVTGMSDTANSSFPLIVNDPASIGQTTVTWSGTTTEKGGIWKGRQALVVHVDNSATIDQLNSSFEDMNGPTGIDLFNTSGANGWMQGSQGSGNNVVAPD